ncbi:DUF4190 domain-containing protein [Marmoricola sp. RAF53]|uniref:DUF4190 domain-containing protein n=1 Tax=Marmoricola sp. RAF53 TaxID=3233059 RepID=UPI003F978450
MTEPQSPPPGYPYPAYPPAPQSTPGSATAALVLGILSIVMCGFVLGIPAIILGSRAKREIDASQGRLGGRSSAQAGFVLGIISTVFSGLATLIVLVVFIFGGVVQSGFEATCSSTTSGTTIAEAC